MLQKTMPYLNPVDSYSLLAHYQLVLEIGIIQFEKQWIFLDLVFSEGLTGLQF